MRYRAGIVCSSILQRFPRFRGAAQEQLDDAQLAHLRQALGRRAPNQLVGLEYALRDELRGLPGCDAGAAAGHQGCGERQRPRGSAVAPRPRAPPTRSPPVAPLNDVRGLQLALLSEAGHDDRLGPRLATVGKADVVFLGVKAHALTSLAPSLPQLFGPDTFVVSTQNGVPWWYFQNFGGRAR